MTNLVGSYLSELPNVARFVGTEEYSGASVGQGSVLCGGGECNKMHSLHSQQQTSG